MLPKNSFEKPRWALFWTRKNILLRSSAKELFTVWFFPEFNASTSCIWIPPSSLPARISSKNKDEIPLPKNQEKCLREKTRQLASAYVRASSARVRNSAFSARWAKPALAPQALLSPTLVPHLNLHRAGGWDPQFRRICQRIFKIFLFKYPKNYRLLKTGLAKRSYLSFLCYLVRNRGLPTPLEIKRPL